MFEFKKEFQLKSSGLNYAQLHTLEKIYEDGAVKTLDISKALDISPSTLIGVLDELEKRGLIRRERQETDKRVVLVSVTKKGETVVKKHYQEDELFLFNLLKDLDESECRDLKQLLDKVTGSITELEQLFDKQK
jgi:DNA-binding MarR family transcriptional regulator